MGIGKRISDGSLDQVEKERINYKESGKSVETVKFMPEEPKYKLENLILPSLVKENILDVAEYAQNSRIVFDQWGLKNTHKFSKQMGINLYGPPGTGKTMAAHAIAEYMHRKILVVSYADIESKYVGETPKNIRKAFEVAKRTNSILFFDEADAILSRRVTNMNNATDVSVNQTRSVLLMLLNEHDDFIIFATNFIENFDPAFMRRIAKHVEFVLPDEDCRYKLWRMYTPLEMPNDFDFRTLAKKYEGISGSDISTAILMTAFRSVRNKDSCVKQQYLETITDEILKSKAENGKNKAVTTKRVVSEEYAKSQMQKG